MTTPEERRIIVGRFLQDVRDLRAVACPVGEQLLAEILDGIDLIVGDDHLPLDLVGADAAEIEGEGHHRLTVGDRARHVGVVDSRQRPVLDELVFQDRRCADRRFAKFRLRGGVGIAPIDAVVVAAGAEYVLGASADAEKRQIAGCASRPLDALPDVVHGKLRARAVVKLDLVLGAVGGTDRPGDIAQGPGKDIQVVGQRRLHERHPHADTRALEPVEATGGHNHNSNPFSLRQRRGRFRLRAHQTVGLAVDADQADERMVVPRPVLRRRIVQMVAFRPDAQERTAGDERDRGWAESGGDGRRSPRSD